MVRLLGQCGRQVGRVPHGGGDALQAAVVAHQPAASKPAFLRHVGVGEDGAVPDRLPAAAVFRAAVPGDVADVVALVNSAYRGEPGRAGWTTEADLLGGQRTDAAEVAAAIGAAGAEMLLAEDAGDGLLACCHLARRAGDGVHLGMVAVRPSRQGSGIGTALIVEAERRARAWGAARAELNVIAQRSELIAWYGRLGYRPTGQTRPFPYGEVRFGVPLRGDLAFTVLAKALPGA